MGDPFPALQMRVAKSALSREDKRALILAVKYLNLCALAVELRDGCGGEQRVVKAAQDALGEAAGAMKAVACG